MQKKIKNYILFTKLFSAGLFISGIIPIIIIASSSIYNFKQLSINNIESTIRQVTEHRHEAVRTFLQDQLAFLTTVIDLYPLAYLKNPENLEHLFLAINKKSGEGTLVDLQLIDTDGRQIGYIGPYHETGPEDTYKGSPWFDHVLARGVHVSDVYSPHHPPSFFSIALTDPLKTYVMRATIHSAALRNLLYSALIGANGDAFIINTHGELQTQSLQEVPSADTQEFKRFRQHRGTEIINDGVYLYGSKWLNNNSWLLVVKTRITDSLQGYYIYRDRIIAIAVFTFVAFLLISIVTGRFIVNWMQDADREQSALDQQMAHIEKMANIGRLAAGIAHEINNPLQMIQMQAGLVEEMLVEEQGIQTDEYLKSLAKIKHHVSRAGAITHRLLGFSGKISAKYGVQINELLRETISFLENEAQRNEIVFKLQLDDALPTIRTDGAQVQQALLNIIENALDAVGTGGQVWILTSSTHKEIQIRVEDNGPGFKPEILKKIWEPFFTTKEAGRGTGLGLSICSDIIHKLGGTISAENRSEGGARFIIRLPIRS